MVDTRRNVDIGSIEVVLGRVGWVHEAVRGGEGGQQRPLSRSPITWVNETRLLDGSGTCLVISFDEIVISAVRMVCFEVFWQQAVNKSHSRHREI